MRIIADGQMATLLEIEQVIEWLEESAENLADVKEFIKVSFKNYLWLPFET